MGSYSTRVRYGLRLLVRLALQGSTHHLSIGDIAVEEGVSVKYLEQIVSLLKPLGILTSVRGARGGYILQCDPSEITMDKVFKSLGGLKYSTPCFVDATSCERIEVCTTRPFWQDFDAYMRRYLEKVTLAEIVAKAPRGGVEFSLNFSCASEEQPELTKADSASR